jgi:Uncharacterised nucleotidyltransferase
MLSDSFSPASIFDTLGTLLLAREDRNRSDGSGFAGAVDHVSHLDPKQFRYLLEQAEVQRVLRRTLEVLQENLALKSGSEITGILNAALDREKQRQENTLAYLSEILDAFEGLDHPVMVMKSLDHWPDTGSDLDLLVSVEDREACRIFETGFHASRQSQSWGDRLAHKFNFRIPGLPELVEVHVGCLGQTGEHTALATGALARHVKAPYGRYCFPVPSLEDRIVIATLQRMYRHYYIRLTDIVNVFGLLACRSIDFDRLRAIAQQASIWEGVATLLVIVQQYGTRYGGSAPALPDSVLAAAQFSAQATRLRRNFVRVPLVPEAAKLYLRQFAAKGQRHSLRTMMRLTLLPFLATAAFLTLRVTGNDKGIW